MRIIGYHFGCMEIDEHSYRSDLILSRAGVKEPWWRQKGHQLQIEDLAEILAQQPDILVVGTGYYGRMKVPEPVRDYLAERGVELHAEQTSLAVKRFNDLQRNNARLVGAFHLTC